MTTVPIINSPGKFQVLFNGTQLRCFHDTDCPGAGICAINQTWSVQPGGWCMCYSRAGLTGDFCNQVCEIGTARIVLACFVVIVGLIITIVGGLALISVIGDTKRDTWSVLNLTLLSITTGSLLTIAYELCTFATTLGFPSFYEVLFIGSREMRRSPQQLEYATFILLVLSQCVTVCAPLLLPLVWIDLANGALNLKKRSIRFVKAISITSCLVTCFVQFPLYVLAATNFQGGVEYYGNISANIWYAIYGFITLANLAAATKILVVFKAIKDRPRSEVNVRIETLLARVLKAASLLVMNYAVFIGLIVGAQARQVRESR
jgi:hypothetical protein